ncbi:MAG: putative multidrug export ATP-binding/permease protein [Paracidovorax wautersii]|uniref:Putative multidrug export ATP-binding/permease protein n=1 Tax=Paracidovorax wautersii TaxID=1177982 RepID=A0A7V8FMK4_9BURK|nr:MAG: putative multidrug export ATP-binding/permease protein [Paracidovorax wautersii]
MFRFLESLIQGTRSPSPHAPPARLGAFYWHFIGQTKGPYLAMVATCLLLALADMGIPVVIGQVVHLLEAPDRAAALSAHGTQLAMMLGLVLLLRPLLQAVDLTVRHNVLVPGVTSLVRWQSHWHVVRQGWPFFQKDFAGRIANRVMQTAEAMRDSVISSIRALTFITTYGLFALVLTALADWRLGLPTLVWLCGYAGFLRHFVPRLRKLARERSDLRSLVVARVVDSYSNILTVKLFARLADEDAYVREAVDDHQRAIAGHMRMTARFLLTLNAMNALLLVSTAASGLWLWGQGLVGAAQVATAIPLAWQIANASGWVSFEIASIFENIGTVQDGMDTIAVPHALLDAPEARPLRVTQGGIRLQDLHFSYGGPRPVIDGIDLAVRPGERIGLVGRSGSGKSTLVNLLLRFYDVERGSIAIDGQDVRGVTQESLRAAIGLVTQDTSLLHRSIADNIRYGRPEATLAEVMQAARTAQADGFISQLSDWRGRTGYDAHVGERGVKLSGGQRQRIAIARVILKNAPILVLDEATSALDSEIEAAIQEQLVGLMEGKTVIAIAHRLSTIARMDRLVILDQGRIVEQGTHTELLRRGGHYAALWRHQSGGFLPDELPTAGAPAGEDASALA